jgi:hypothetical protein
MCLNYLKNAHRKQRKNAQESDYTTLQVSKRSPPWPIIKSELKNRAKTVENRNSRKNFQNPRGNHRKIKNPPKIQNKFFCQHKIPHFKI